MVLSYHAFHVGEVYWSVLEVETWLIHFYGEGGLLPTVLQGIILLLHHSFAHTILHVYLQDEFSEVNCWVVGQVAL